MAKNVARLIATAPEMLALLRKARAVLADHETFDYDDDPGGGNNDDVLEMEREIDALLARIDGTR
jgi:hypothetical protein